MHAITPLKGFTFGCDPELFILDETGRPVSAEGLIPGTKAVPFTVPGGAVQVDGMAAEFNTDPASTFEEFNSNITKVLKSLKTMLPDGHSLVALPSIVFDQDVWDNSPDCAKELGCSPDFNAWTGSVNSPPKPKKSSTMRTASGHLHIGWTDGASLEDAAHIKHCQDLVKQLDWYLGAWSLSQDNDPVRRSLYGQAGACRYKDYGVEYRVLSNFWVFSPKLRLQVWNRMNKAILDMRTAFMPEKFSHYNLTLVDSINKSTINNNLVSDFHFPIHSI